MDAIYSILPQTQSANGAAGSAAPDPAEAGLFASMLAGQTAPVAPVPAIPSRPNGGNPFAASTSSQTAPVLTSLTQSPAASGVADGTLPAAGNSAEAASLPPSPTTGAQASGETANPVPAPTTTPGSASGTTEAAGPVGVIIDGNNAPVSSSGSAALTPVPGADTAQSGKTGPAQPASDNGTQVPLPEGADKSVVKTNMPVVPNGVADNAVKSNEAVQLAQSASAAQPSANPAAPQSAGAAAAAAGNAPKSNEAVQLAQSASIAQPSGSPAAPQSAGAIAAAATTTAATATALPQAPVQAGVQARREASGSDKMQPAGTSSVSKSAAPNGANSSTAATPTSVSSVKPETAPPAPPQTPSPTTKEMPAEAVRLAQSDAARTAPPPVDGAQTDAAAEAEQADMSNLRAADASRAAERPGTAAGSARFTPAAAGTLAAQIAAKFQNGERRFEIRMDPPELGRIEVKLQVGNDNRVQAMLSAERPETLNDLRQYARELERALEEAGLQLDNDGLSFELSQGEEDEGQMPQGSGRFSSLEFAEDLAGPITAAAPPRELYGFQLSARSGVDIRL